MAIHGGACDKCGSNLLGFVCRCGEMRCSCEDGPCAFCEQQEEYRQEEERHEAEMAEREDFERRMDEKYRGDC